MKITKNGKELAREKYSLREGYKEIFRSLEDGLNIDCYDDCKIDCCGDNCKIKCYDDCKIDCCGDNCRINCGGNCYIDCHGDNCEIDCWDSCKIRASKGTEIKYYYMGDHLTYKFKERKTILCKDGEFVEQ